MSIAGIVGALSVNLTITYISTILFSILAFIYGGIVMAYMEALIIAICIIVSQMLLICEMMEGIVTKQDDALLSKEGQEVIKIAQSFVSDV
jgi:hypothetical protein